MGHVPIAEALHRLTQECALAGKAELVGYLTPYLATPEDSAIPYEEMARQFHRPIATLRSDVARLRARYRAILREEVRAQWLKQRKWMTNCVTCVARWLHLKDEQEQELTQ